MGDAAGATYAANKLLGRSRTEWYDFKGFRALRRKPKRSKLYILSSSFHNDTRLLQTCLGMIDDEEEPVAFVADGETEMVDKDRRCVVSGSSPKPPVGDFRMQASRRTNAERC